MSHPDVSTSRTAPLFTAVRGRSVLVRSLLLSTSVTVTEVRKRRRNCPRSAEIGRRRCDVMATSSAQSGAPPKPISFPSGS